MGWFKKLTKQIESFVRQVDPVGPKLHDELAKIPGSHFALEEGLLLAAKNEVSWDPYGGSRAVGDVWGGGTKESQDPEKRKVGRAIGTIIGLSFAAGAAAGGTEAGTAGGDIVATETAVADAEAGALVNTSNAGAMAAGDVATVNTATAATDAAAMESAAAAAPAASSGAAPAASSGGWLSTAKQVVSGASLVSGVVKAATSSGAKQPTGTGTVNLYSLGTEPAQITTKDWSAMPTTATASDSVIQPAGSSSSALPLLLLLGGVLFLSKV